MRVGDKVRIAPRRGRPYDYSFNYIDDMVEYAGKTATIVNIRKSGDIHRTGNIPDDGKVYTLDIDNGQYEWASSMLLPANTSTTDQIKEVLKVRVADDDNRYQINFNL